MVALFVLIAVLGQIINNTATTLIVLPIAVAGAASLLTPIATQVVAAGRYRGHPTGMGVLIHMGTLLTIFSQLAVAWRSALNRRWLHA